MTSGTKLKDGELVVNPIIDDIIGNALKMSRKRPHYNWRSALVQIIANSANEEHERISLPAPSLNFENKTLISET